VQITKDLFGITSLHQLQLSFNNFITEQLNLKFSKVCDSMFGWQTNFNFKKMRI
jgi:hypothetical protein